MDSDPSAAVRELTAHLVGIDSVNPGLVPGAAGEAAIADATGDRLAGWRVDRVVAASDPRRVSLVAVHEGDAPGPTVVLNGHLDTVGVDGMPEPFTARIVGDRLHGRGASDMKGGVAGLVVAAQTLVARGVGGRIVLALVADEEDASVGAVAVIEHLRDRGIVADVCLIAEPTWLDLVAAHRGYELLRVELTGRAAHSSQPELGADVIRPLAVLLAGIAERDAGLRAVPPHPLLGAGSLMATVVHAGSAPFTVAARAEIAVERRTLPGEAPGIGAVEVQRLLDASLDGAPGVTGTLTPVTRRDAWEGDRTGPAARLSALLGDALARRRGAAPAASGAPYWMESALWQTAGVPTVVCGPAGGGLHAVDEWMSLDQLDVFPLVVADAVARFLEEPA